MRFRRKADMFPIPAAKGKKRPFCLNREVRGMREKPSRGYLEWALSRFGAEWVEANLQVNSNESELTTTSSAPLSPREKKMTVVRASKPLRLLTDYRPQQMPSIN